MTVRTRVAGVEDCARMQQELVSLLAARGVLHCAGVVAAILDTGEVMANTARDRAVQGGTVRAGTVRAGTGQAGTGQAGTGQAGTGQAEAGPGAP